MAKKKQKQATVKVQERRVEVFTSPESSNVEGASYYPDTQECVIAFRDKKRPDSVVEFYQYLDPPMTNQDWEAFKQAESKGKFVATVIKKKYKGVKIA